MTKLGRLRHAGHWHPEGELDGVLIIVHAFFPTVVVQAHVPVRQHGGDVDMVPVTQHEHGHAGLRFTFVQPDPVHAPQFAAPGAGSQ